MAIVYQLVNRDEDVQGNPLQEYPAIPHHYMAAAILGYARGQMSRAALINNLSVTPANETSLDALLALIDAKGTLQDKINLVMAFEKYGTLYEAGKIDSDQFINLVSNF